MKISVRYKKKRGKHAIRMGGRFALGPGQFGSTLLVAFSMNTTLILQVLISWLVCVKST